MPDIILSPFSATLIFVIGVLAGVQYRRVWKEEGPRWQLWVFGLVAASCLVIVAFLPLAPG